MNKITRKQVGNELFSSFIDDAYDVSYDVHRRGSSFFRKEIFEIDAQWFPDVDPKFYGFWESNEFVWDENWAGREEIYELNRVEKKEKTVIVTSWVSVGIKEKITKETEDFLKRMAQSD